VASQSEERRRLHRDLHDGLGPTLAAIVLKLDVAQRRSDAARRDALLDEVRVDARSAVDEIRRVVEDLRPTALEEAGLVDALRARARSLSTGDTAFDVVGPDPMPSIAGLVEEAAYRIASEAMTNVAKHACARRCHVEIALGEVLVLSILDDGHGARLPITPGAGSRTMAERAAGLGGTCTIGPGPGCGTLVRVELPVHDRALQPESAGRP
jgi:two-component system NarL family sensor kinase